MRKLLEPSIFWKNVDRILAHRNCTYVDFCKVTGIPHGTLTMQRSRQTLPKIGQLVIMSNYMEVSLDELITGEHYEPLSSRSLNIAQACERAEEEDLYVIEKILGLKKAPAHPVSTEEIG